MGGGGLAWALGVHGSPGLGTVHVSGPRGDDSSGDGGAYHGRPKHTDSLPVSIQRWDKRAGEAQERARRWQPGGGGQSSLAGTMMPSPATTPPQYSVLVPTVAPLPSSTPAPATLTLLPLSPPPPHRPRHLATAHCPSGAHMFSLPQWPLLRPVCCQSSLHS